MKKFKAVVTFEIEADSPPSALHVDSADAAVMHDFVKPIAVGMGCDLDGWLDDDTALSARLVSVEVAEVEP